MRGGNADIRGIMSAQGEDRDSESSSEAGRRVGDAAIPLRVVQGVASDERHEVRDRAEDDRRHVGGESQEVAPQAAVDTERNK